MDAILYCAERRREVGGGIELLVDPAWVRATMSDGRYSLEQVWKLIEELREATVEIKSERVHALGGLLDHVTRTEMTRRNPLDGAERHLWTVRLGLPFCELIKHDFALYYDPSPIARLGHGISQALARHVLTHKRAPAGGWYLDGLIKAVAGELVGQQLADARFRVRADADGLAAAGIRIEGNRVSIAHPLDNIAHPPDSIAQTPDALRSRPGVSGLSG
jgi:biotin operon repressor